MSELGQDALVSLELVPREAFREAIANALVHRCWDVNASINVRMFPDRIEVTSPGGLPDGITEEMYLAGGPSVARNPILANVFFRLGHIERFRTGIPRIIEASIFRPLSTAACRSVRKKRRAPSNLGDYTPSMTTMACARGGWRR